MVINIWACWKLMTLCKIMKTNMKKEYTRRVKKVLASKLKGGNVIEAINTWVVSLLRCNSGVINWTKNELANLDRKTRQLPSVPTKMRRGRGLTSVEDAIYTEERNVKGCVIQSQERLLKSAWKRKNINEVETSKEYKDTKKRERIEDWRAKELHGQFKTETEELSSESWSWILWTLLSLVTVMLFRKR